MASVSAPFGLSPVSHPSGTPRPRALNGGISASYTTPMYIGTPVKLVAAGTLEIGGAAEAIVGSFAGCDYTDAQGRRKTGYWPGTAGATDIVAYFYDDPSILYAAQSSATLAATAVGDQANIVSPTTGSTITQISSAQLGTLVGAGVQGTLRIVDLYLDPDNNWGDSFVTVIVQIARHQYLTPQTAI